jgi:hypothetical protein
MFNTRRKVELVFHGWRGWWYDGGRRTIIHASEVINTAGLDARNGVLQRAF